MTSASRSVVKTTASCISVRSVATSVHFGMIARRSAVGAADNVKVISPLAGCAGCSSRANQVEKHQHILVRHLVQPEDILLCHPGEQLDQRNARVADIVVRPIRAKPRNLPFRLVHGS